MALPGDVTGRDGKEQLESGNGRVRGLGGSPDIASLITCGPALMIPDDSLGSNCRRGGKRQPTASGHRTSLGSSLCGQRKHACDRCGVPSSVAELW